MKDKKRLLDPGSVLYEDNHLLVISKPAGIATMGALPGEASIHGMASDYLKTKYHKPGNVYLGIVSRLDAHVSGVIVLARTSKAASRLSEQFRNSDVEKKYLAVVAGLPDSTSPMVTQLKNGVSQLTCFLRKNDRLKRVEAFTKEVANSKLAVLNFSVIRSHSGHSLLEVDLQTGRKHQIRAQFAELGCPVFGDRKYGSTGNMGQQIALHANSLAIIHPTRKEPLSFEAPIPEHWHKYRAISDLLDGF